MPEKAFSRTRSSVLKLAATLAALVIIGQPAIAGFRSPESVVRNVYAYYGDRSSELSRGLPHDAAVAERYFSARLKQAWIATHDLPFDFMVQSSSWKLGGIAISISRRQFDKTYVAVTFDNAGRRVMLNFIVIDSTEGWLIDDVESPHDSLNLYLSQHAK